MTFPLFTIAKGKTPRSRIIFDIGSGSVGGALVTYATDSAPRVRYSRRLPIPFQQELDFERFVRAMLSTLLDVALKVQSEGIPAMVSAEGKSIQIDEVLCIFSAPWTLSNADPLTEAQRTVCRHGGIG